MLESCGFKVKKDPNGSVRIATLGPFHATTHNYYFELEGTVPADIARELQQHPIGRTEIRVDGYGGLPEDWPVKADVDVFHIDSWAGLYVFVKTLQKHGLVRLPDGL